MEKLLLNSRTLAVSFLLLCLFLTAESFGQVTTVQNWSNLYNSNSSSSQTISYTVPAGSNTNRVLAVAISSSQTGVGARTVTITYGGQTMTLAAGNMGTTTTRQHTAIYYLNEAGLDAASNSNLVFTVSGGTTIVTTVWAAVFDYVDQTTPLTNSQNYNSVTTNVSTFVFGTALSINDNDQAVLVLSSLRVGSNTTRAISTLPTNFTSVNEQTDISSSDAVRDAILSRSVPTSNTSSTCSTVMNNNSLGSMTGVSFKGCVPATANAGSALTTICQGGTSAALGGSVGGSATGGTWSSSAGGTFTPNATALNATWTPPAGYSGTATLTLTSSGGSCGTAVATKTQLVNPAPTSVTANASSASICAGGNINLTSSATSNSAISAALINENFNGAGTPAGWTNNANTGTGGAAGNWTLRPNNYDSGTNFGITISSNDASQFYLSDSDVPGSGTTTITSLQSPSFSTVGASTATLTFYHYYRDNNADFADVQISTNGTTWTTLAPNPTNTFPSSRGNATSFQLETYNLASYLGQPTVYILFKYNASYGYYWAIDNVVVNATYATPPPPTYAWTSTPGGYTSSIQNPTGVTPSGNTSYTMTATNSYGCTASATTSTVAVNSNVAASVSIAASPSSTICAGTNVTFTATPTNGGTPSYQWKLNGSNVGTNSPTYSNNTLANGNTVSVVMTSNAACVTGSPATSNTVAMTVNTGSTAASISGNASICSASSTNLQVAIAGGVSPYTLVYSGGTINNYVSNANIPVSPSSTTGYTITSVTDANGCPGTGNTGTATVTVGASTSSSDGVTWTNGAPTSATNVIFTGAGTINIGANLNACSLTVNGPTVSVTSGFNVDLNGALKVNSGSFTLNNNANLIQHNSNYTNSGNIIVKRNSAALNRLDYTLWSTPVTGQGLYAFSKFTLPNRFYVYNSSNDQFSNAVGFNLTGLQYPSPLVAPNGVNGTDTANVQFVNGKGYLIRVPYDHPTAPTSFVGTFTGVPNNGNITISSLTNGSYYATGNPYPSTIDADQFMIDNNIGDSQSTPGDGIYFWRKTNNAAAASYATYTTAGGVPSGGDTLSIVPGGVIQVGEGFIVKTTSTSLGFNNGQRIANNGNQFLRTNNTIERNRIWLKLSNGSADINQMMVAYMTGATQDVDATIDGRFFKDSPTALNSLIDSEEFAIQGRSLPFEASDVVPLAFKAETAGSFTIAIDHVDGLFTGGAQAIYLKDNLTTTVHNLETAYTFATTAGTFNNRFEIVYQPELANPVFSANTVIIYSQGNGFVVNSGNFVMSSIKVFDIRGRLIEEKKAINANEAMINGGLANEVLLVQITTQDGVTVTKKVIK